MAENDKLEEPWAPLVITALQEAGIIPRYAQRVVIDLRAGNDPGWVEVHITSLPDPAKSQAFVDVLLAELRGAKVITHEGDADGRH